jgi:hypothetical protein
MLLIPLSGDPAQALVNPAQPRVTCCSARLPAPTCWRAAIRVWLCWCRSCLTPLVGLLLSYALPPTASRCLCRSCCLR